MRAVPLALAITLLAASGLGAQTTVLRCGALVDGVSDAVRRDVAITVVGERIEAVGPFAATEGNAAAVVDLSDQTCLPGLIDAHAHILIETDDYQVDHLRRSSAYSELQLTPTPARSPARPYMSENSPSTAPSRTSPHSRPSSWYPRSRRKPTPLCPEAGPTATDTDSTIDAAPV